MPIVSNTVVTTVQQDASFSVVVRMYDQNALEYTELFFAPPGFDVETKVDSMISSLNRQLAEDEFQQLVGA